MGPLGRCPGHAPVGVPGAPWGTPLWSALQGPWARGPCGAGLGTGSSLQGAPPWGAAPGGSPEEASGRGHRPDLPPGAALRESQGGALGGHTHRRSVLAWCRLGQVCVWDARRGASGAVFWRFRGVVGPNLDPRAPLGSTHSVSVRSLPSTATFGPSTSPH